MPECGSSASDYKGFAAAAVNSGRGWSGGGGAWRMGFRGGSRRIGRCR